MRRRSKATKKTRRSADDKSLTRGWARPFVAVAQVAYFLWRVVRDLTG